MDINILVGVITEIHDGDSITASFHPTHTAEFIWRPRLRFAHINAPELSTDAGKAALAYLETLLSVGQNIYAELLGFDNFGRTLANIFIKQSDTVSVNILMVQSGHAVPMNFAKQLSSKVATWQ